MMSNVLDLGPVFEAKRYTLADHIKKILRLLLRLPIFTLIVAV
jgi:hypothetical protein